MPDGGKKKRPRKRQRKRTTLEEAKDDEGSKHSDGEVEEINTENDETSKNKVPEEKNTVPATSYSTLQSMVQETEKPAPSISFYQRTNPHKPSALASLHGNIPRRYTVSVALPGSIILNAQSPELQSRLAGQLARSCAIFNIDEIVVFNDGETDQFANGSRTLPPADEQYGDAAAVGPFDPNAFLARILQYVETPQYLRKSLFPMHRDLRMAGILAPLDCPHHLRFEEESPYREGITVEAPYWSTDRHSIWVYIGFKDPIQCQVKGKAFGQVPLGARVTVKMPEGGKKVGHIVSPREPVQEKGLYWGYTTRLCNSLSEAIGISLWNEAYDLVIGTSERGSSLTDVIQATISGDSSNSLIPFRHALIVFGGLSGLEVAVEQDIKINLTADDASELFDSWINVVEGQGSRTIRTEEALLITLSRLKTTLESLGQN